MPDNRNQIRQKRLLEELDRHELDAFALNPGPSLLYLTGLSFHLSERPIVAIFRPDGVPIIVLPELETGKLRSVPIELRTFTYGEDPTTWGDAFEAAADEAGLDYRRMGVEPTRLRVLELRLLEEAAPRAAYINGEDTIAAIRAVKDEAEINLIQRAAEIAEKALEVTLASIRPGITEQTLARELTLQLLRAGSEPELPFSPIVAFGANAANPHAVASERALEEGDVILIDWGAGVDGYSSDLTRVFCWGEPDDEISTIAAIVAEANQAARERAGPGVPAGEVDRAARAVIEAAGYGDRFTHRTGHGLGLDGHEAPYIRSDNREALLPGMVFTVEPGIYLPDRGGIRIEDDVVVTAEGSVSLSSMERSLCDLEPTAKENLRCPERASGSAG